MFRAILFLLLFVAISKGMFAIIRSKIHRVAKTLVGVGIGTIGVPFSATAAQTLQEQLKVLQALQTEEQIIRVQKVEKSVDVESLDFLDEQKIVRGLITLAPFGVDDSSKYPLGFTSASLLNPQFDSNNAALFVTAVGRDGPPVAAHK